MKSISHDEYLSGKYQNVSSDSSGNHEAKVWYKDNGSINEELTYSDNYQRSNGIGRYAKKSSSSSSSSSSSKKSSSSGGGIGKAVSSFFSSNDDDDDENRSSSRKRSSFSNSTNSSTMQREKTYAEIDAELKSKRFGNFVSDLVGNPDLEINEAVLDKVRVTGMEIGYSADEAEADFMRAYKFRTDPEYVVNRGISVKQAFTYHCRCPKQREQLIHYMKYAIISKAIKKIYGENDSIDSVKTFMSKLESTISLHYSNDAEIQALYAQLKKDYNIVKHKNRLPLYIPLGVIGTLILLIMLGNCAG